MHISYISSLPAITVMITPINSCKSYTILNHADIFYCRIFHKAKELHQHIGATDLSNIQANLASPTPIGRSQLQQVHQKDRLKPIKVHYKNETTRKAMFKLQTSGQHKCKEGLWLRRLIRSSGSGISRSRIFPKLGLLLIDQIDEPNSAFPGRYFVFSQIGHITFFIHGE